MRFFHPVQMRGPLAGSHVGVSHKNRKYGWKLQKSSFVCTNLTGTPLLLVLIIRKGKTSHDFCCCISGHAKIGKLPSPAGIVFCKTAHFAHSQQIFLVVSPGYTLHRQSNLRPGTPCEFASKQKKNCRISSYGRKKVFCYFNDVKCQQHRLVVFSVM